MSIANWIRTICLSLILTFAMATGVTAGQNVPGLDRGETGSPNTNAANLFFVATPSTCDEFDQTLASGIHPTCAID